MKFSGGDDMSTTETATKNTIIPSLKSDHRQHSPEITELQQLKEELSAKYNLLSLLEAILDSDHECIVGVNKDEKIVMRNMTEAEAKENFKTLAKRHNSTIENH